MPASQSYCRHTNTLEELQQVWEKWYEFDPDLTQEELFEEVIVTLPWGEGSPENLKRILDREITARAQLLELIAEMAGELLLDALYA
jgi:hypothetical protein